MKISYITMQFPVPSETFASQDINVLLDLGNVVDVYCLRPKSKEYDSLIHERHKDRGIKVSHLNLSNFIRGVFFIFLYPSVAVGLIKWVFQINNSYKDLIKSILLIPSVFYILRLLQYNRPDIVHLFWGHYPSMLLFLLRELIPDLPFTMFLGAHDLETNYKGSVYMSHFASRVFTHSFNNIAPLVKMGIQKDKIKVLHRGALVDDFSIKQVVNKKIHLERGVFLTAARLIQEKGIDEVLDIFLSFAQNKPLSRLLIAGDGPYKKELEKYVHNCQLDKQVIFLGHIPQVELYVHMIKADFFVLMSRYKAERLPNVLKEAMLRKCVCITTYTRGIDELIDNRKSGFIFNKKNEVIKFLEEIQENSSLLHSVVDEAQRKIINNFNVELIMQKYLKIWRDSLKMAKK